MSRLPDTMLCHRTSAGVITFFLAFPWRVTDGITGQCNDIITGRTMAGQGSDKIAAWEPLFFGVPAQGSVICPLLVQRQLIINSPCQTFARELVPPVFPQHWAELVQFWQSILIVTGSYCRPREAVLYQSPHFHRHLPQHRVLSLTKVRLRI